MSLSSLQCAFRNIMAVILLFVFPLSIWAQDAQPAPAQTNATAPPSSQALPAAPSSHQHSFVVEDYAKPKRAFPNLIAPYTSRNVPPPDLTNTPRIEQLMRDGKIYLSMDDAVALALENNLDIGIARYNLNIADTDVLRAKSGANQILGVNTGIVQNTPGGGVGGLSGTVGSGPGGTSPASGGIGAGTSGIVNTTEGLGSVITSFDPIVTGTLQSDHARFIPTSPFSGTAQNTTTGNFSYLQGFQSGTNVSVGFTNSRVTSNNPFQTVSPALSSGFQFKISQHLLQGFGFLPNDRLIRISKNDREITDVAFRLQILTTVDQIENLYWNLVYAYENVKVQQEALAFAQKTLSDNQKQVQIGSLAPIEVVRAQNSVATDQQNLVQAQTNLDLQQLLMKNALSRTLQDPQLASAEVIPTTTMALPQQEPVVPTEDLINEALQHRPDLAESRIDLVNRDISARAIKNALLPSLDLFAYYGGSGTGGAQNSNYICVNQPTNSFCNGFAPTPPISYGSTLNDLINSAAPDKGAGVTLTIPIRNREAQALQVRSQLEYRQAQMRLQQIENQVRIEVRNAQFTVTQNRAAVEASQAAVALAQQSLEAEQKKFRLGASTGTNVLNYQSQLAVAKSNQVSAEAAYEKAEIELDRATGLLLEHAGIVMSDAVKGEVTHMPKIPYVAPSQDVRSVMPTSDGQQPQNQQPAPPQ
ncbi:MAG TPA: TolC family protein [Terriglobales bacterium]|nr:TolC family protein [Terriglobales bacterium]